MAFASRSARLLLGLSLVAMSSSVTADGAGKEREEARAHFEQGNSAFALGRYAAAALEYEKAFALRSDSALLYNAAQAHRMANNKARALELYQNYLRVFPKVTNREEVQRHIATLKTAIETEQRSQSSPPTAPVPIDGQVTPEPVAIRPTPPPPPVSRVKLYAGIGVAVGGVALVAAGGALFGVARSAANEINHPVPGYIFNPATESAVKTDQLAGGILLGIGGAAVVAGTVLAILGAREARPSKLAVLPVGSRDGAGVLVHYSF